MGASTVEPSANELPNRREFLGKACTASACATCVLAGVPVAGYLFPGEAGAGAGPVSFPSADLCEGAGKLVRVGSRRVLVIRSGGQLTAVDAKCTHLACIIAWDSASQLIRCNCHGGVFHPDGKRISGPPPRDQESIPVRESGDRVIVG